MSAAIRLATESLERAGASRSNASAVAESLVAAEVHGLPNVGFNYLATYCRHLEIGRIDGRAIPKLHRTAPATLVADAGFGFCQPAFLSGLDQHLEMAKHSGIAAFAIHRSYPAGMIGWFVEKLARRRVVALAFANAGASVAPWGGKKPLFGTNPIALAAPRLAHAPVVIDLSSSATARVNIKAAAERGEEIPLGWAYDRNGRPTTVASEALNGSLAPLGGHKGYCLALMVDILAGGLIGANWSFEAPPAGVETADRPAVGQLFISISPGSVGGEDFGSRFETLAAEIVAQGARVPGERRFAFAGECTGVGLVVTDAMKAAMDRLGWDAGVDGNV